MLRIRKGPIAACALIILLFPVLAGRIAAIDHYVDVMVFAGIYSLIAIGLSLLMGYAGQVSLGHAAFFGIGAYVSGILTTRYGLDPWLCMPAGILVSAAVALAVGTPSLKLRGHYLAMATLAFGIVINIVLREEVAWTGGPDGLIGIPGLSLPGGGEFGSVQAYYYVVWGFVFAVFLFTANLIQSPVGRTLRAIHQSEAAAMAMGLNVSYYKVVIFVYSAGLASLAGSLYAHYMTVINPSTFDLFFSIKLIIIIALGGMHTIWGALAGSILIAFLGFEWLHFFKEFEVMVYGAILLLVTVFLPQGLSALGRTRPRARQSQVEADTQTIKDVK